MKNKNFESVITVLGFMLFFVQGDSFAASPLLIRIASDFGVSISKAGLTAVFYMIPFGLFTIVFGPLGDKIGKMKMISIAAFGTTIFSALGGFAQSLELLCVFRALNGMFAAAIMPVSMALIGDMTGNDPNKLHKRLAKTMGLMFLGGAIAPLVGGALSYFGSWRMVYIIYGIFELIFSILIITTIRVKSKATNAKSIRSTYKEAFNNKKLMPIVMTMSLLGFAILAGFTYMGKYIEINTGVTVFQVGIILTLYGLGTMIGGRLAPKISEKLKDKYLLFASSIGGCSLLLISLIPNLYVISIALLGFGMTFTLIQPFLIAKAQMSHPKNRGTVMSLASFNMSLGAGIGALIYGIIINNFNFNIIYYTGAALLLLVGLIMNKTLKEPIIKTEKVA